jgi:hypothetical protein
MEHLGEKLDFRRLVGVVFAKFQLQLERTTFPSCVIRAMKQQHQQQQHQQRGAHSHVQIDQNAMSSTSDVAPPTTATREQLACNTYPKITACHIMMLFSHGAPLIPSGGSVWRRLKSRINLRRAGVVIVYQSINQSITKQAKRTNEQTNEYKNRST